MTKKKKYTLRALLNEEKIWKEFDRLSLKSKKKDKKSTKIERIKTKRFFNIEKFKAFETIKSLESSFFTKKFETHTSQFIFDSKNTKDKKIETKSAESFFSLRIETSKTQNIKWIETSSENFSITKKKISVIITSIESISSLKTRKTKMRDSSIKSFWDKRNDRKNSNEYLKDIEFIYQTNYKTQEAIEDDKNKYKENVNRILFKQNLREETKNWYSNLSKIVKSDWIAFRTTFKIQFEIEIDAKANKYLLLQRMITLTQRSNEDITNYFRRTKSLTRHLLNAVETIKYNVVKKMKNKIQRERINFECNKNRDFILKKIKLIIQTTYQTINTMSSFDFEWNHSSESFNLDKDKKKVLSIDEWNQQILFNILQSIRNIIMQNERKNKTFDDDEEKEQEEFIKEERVFNINEYEDSRNVICFDCDEKEHYVNECSNSRKLREMRSSSITTQTILSSRNKQNNLTECVLSNQVITVTIRSEEIRKKKITTQVKKKRIIFKKNERINEKHDK